MQHLRDTPPEMRPQVGQQINSLKEEISQLCEQALLGLSQSEQAKRLVEEKSRHHPSRPPQPSWPQTPH